MKWNEYKIKKEIEMKAMDLEEKARVKVNGLWSFLSYAISYKLKELLIAFFAFSFSSSVVFIVNPEWAKFVHDWIAKFFK